MTEHVYFTWPDGRFSYECRGCGACCKGHGIGLDAVAGEVERLAAAEPGVIVFLRRRGAATTAFNPRDRCWFLADDGLCRVETEHGRAAKPAACRLFPFNRVFRLGRWTVVDYNSVICPLRAGGQGGATHADVLAEIEAVRDPAVVGTALPDAGADAFVEGERAIAQACWAAADAGELGPAREGIDGAPVEACFDALGMPWRAPAGETLANALWLTPSLRFNERFGPRGHAGPVLARMWLAWLGFAAIGEQLARRPLGLQELTTIWSEQVPLMHAAARWADAPALEPGPVDLPGDDPGGAVRQLAQALVDNRRARRPLGELVAPRGVDRAAILKLADQVIRAGFSAPSARRR